MVDKKKSELSKTSNVKSLELFINDVIFPDISSLFSLKSASSDVVGNRTEALKDNEKIFLSKLGVSDTSISVGLKSMHVRCGIAARKMFMKSNCDAMKKNAFLDIVKDIIQLNKDEIPNRGKRRAPRSSRRSDYYSYLPKSNGPGGC